MSSIHDVVEKVRRVHAVIVSHQSRSTGAGGILTAALGIALAVAAWAYVDSGRTSVLTRSGISTDGEALTDGTVGVPGRTIFAPAAIERRAIAPPVPTSTVRPEPRAARSASHVAPATPSETTRARVSREPDRVVMAQYTVPSTAPNSEQHPPGIYLIRRGGTRELLEPTVVSQVMDQNGGRTRTAMVSGVRAAIRSTQQYQEFDFIFPRAAADLGAAITGQVTSPRQFVLVQMYEEPDYDEREMDIVAGGIIGPDPEVLVPFSFERTSPGVFRVKPTEPLGIGEFCFFNLANANPAAGASLGLALFDFGVDPQ